MEGVEFTGFVPDIRPVVAEAAALVVPARLGGGTRLKVLEAMALGTPVVATKLGAMGFDARNGEHLLIADRPQEFADAVVSVMQDTGLAAGLAGNAREMVRENYGWRAISEKLDEVIRSAVERRGGDRCDTTTRQLAG
jgi:glycosyltransferase involved in cell wall biosynthesis